MGHVTQHASGSIYGELQQLLEDNGLGGLQVKYKKEEKQTNDEKQKEDKKKEEKKKRTPSPKTRKITISNQKEDEKMEGKRKRKPQNLKENELPLFPKQVKKTLHHRRWTPTRALRRCLNQLDPVFELMESIIRRQ